MYVITGATGRLGSRVVERVLARVPAAEVAVSVRDPAAPEAVALSERGVHVRAGDFTDPATLAHAFEGARRVLVVSAAIRGGGAVAANLAAVDAARSAGAERVLYTSHQAASGTSHFAPQHTHAATETYLRSSDAPFTALRHGFYVSTLEHYVGAGVASGRLALPEDGPFSWTHHDDLAEVDAAALVGETDLDGITAPLTAPELHDLASVVSIVSEVVGRPVERVVLTDDAWTAAAVGGGMPAPLAEFTLGMFRAARAGEFAVTDPTLERVLGRPATTTRAALEAMLVRR